MTYSSGGPGYPGAQQPGGYAPTAQIPKVDDGPSKLPLYLLAGVAILGLAAYLLSFGPVWKSSDVSSSPSTTLGIIAMLFAAVFAVVALLPKQGNHTPVVTATAVVGFLLTIWDLIKGADAAGWALIVIVILAALQTVSAVSVLLLDSGVITPPAPRPKYDPYQQPYGGGFYGQPQFSGPPSGPLSAPPHGPQGFNQPQGFPQYGGGYPGGGPTSVIPMQGQQVGPPTPPTGFPTYAQPPSAPASGEQQPAAPPEGATQVAPLQQDSSSPSGPPPS